MTISISDYTPHDHISLRGEKEGAKHEWLSGTGRKPFDGDMEKVFLMDSGCTVKNL